MNNIKEIIRLADVGELENVLRRDLEEEEQKGCNSDIVYCESIRAELDDLSYLPTIDPKCLQSVAHWKNLEDAVGDPIIWECSNCQEAIVMYDGSPKDNDYKFCPICGARMEDVTND